MPSVACPNCHREIPKSSSHCSFCGTAASGSASEPVRAPPEHRGYSYDAVAALVLAIAAFLIWPLAILAVVYGLAALRTSREQKERNERADRGRWMAVTAVVISVVIVPLTIYGVVVA